MTVGAGPVFIAASPDFPVEVHATAGSRVYFGDRGVSLTAHDGFLEVGGSVVLTVSRWFVSTGSTNLLEQPREKA